MAKLLEGETAIIRARTVCPGTLDPMAPECLDESPKYDVRLDIFSFGHLAIYLVNQLPPCTLDSVVTVLDVQKNQRQVGKRRRALDQMSHQLGGFPSSPLLHCCPVSSDTPDQRPTSRDLVKRMQEICKQHPIPQGNTLQTLAELTKKQKLETELRNELMTKNAELIELKKVLNDQLAEVNEELARKDHQLTESKKKTATKDRQLTESRRETATKNRQVIGLRRETAKKDHQLTVLKREKATKDRQLTELRREKGRQLTDMRRKTATKDHQQTDLRKGTTTKDHQLIDLRRETATKDHQPTVLREEAATKDH